MKTTSYEPGDFMGSAGSVHYLAQIDNSLISVQVTGPLADYTFVVAYWLPGSQATCVTAGGTCEVVTMSNGDGMWTLTERGIVFEADGTAENEWAR